MRHVERLYKTLMFSFLLPIYCCGQFFQLHLSHASYLIQPTPLPLYYLASFPPHFALLSDPFLMIDCTKGIQCLHMNIELILSIGRERTTVTSRRGTAHRKILFYYALDR